MAKEYVIDSYIQSFRKPQTCPHCSAVSLSDDVEVLKLLRVSEQKNGKGKQILAYFDSNEEALNYIDLLNQEKRDEANEFFNIHNRMIHESMPQR